MQHEKEASVPLQNREGAAAQSVEVTLPAEVQSHYVFEAPVRIWHWGMVLCMMVLIPTGYWIGKPLPSVQGEATYLFYMGYIRFAHFAAGLVFIVGLLFRIYWAFVGNKYSRELFVPHVWEKDWWHRFFYEVRWYLFLEKKPHSTIGHNPIAQTAMFGYILLSIYMALTGLALYSENTQYAIFKPFRAVVEFFYWTGGNSIDIHSWHRLGMWMICVFILGHVYLAIREDIMSNDTMISTMVNGYRSPKVKRRKIQVAKTQVAKMQVTQSDIAESKAAATTKNKTDKQGHPE
ncbi:Ni/Fe-hydrogenase, b-type cytochrome subunit [Plesiomonas shigelloides]|nr:Ni/Fe-hydrogenase, b-type cytochrome subunit [Plesiomonas shigelloides]